MVLIMFDIAKSNDYPNKIFTLGFYTLFSMRKINTEWGTFWIYLHQESNSNYYVYVLKSNLILLKSVGDPKPFYKLEEMKSQINNILNEECGHEKRIRERNKAMRKLIFKDWNGSTTLQVERDQKLKELL
jgi:hypothetical protein